MKRKVLITNYFVRNYSGSELAAVDVANYFLGQGDQVTLAAFDIGDPLFSKVSDDIRFVFLAKDEPLDTYDIIWAHHWPMLTRAIELGARSQRIIACSLSPYEPLERFPLYNKHLSICLTNSQETLSVRSCELSNPNQHLFLNSVEPAFLEHQVTVPKELRKIAIVDNSKFDNQGELTHYFESRDISVTYFGGEQGRYERISPEVLLDYDLVLTIGRTVQYCLALGIPVYCFGRFGGPGYLTYDNFELNEQYNFSGRQKEVCYQFDYEDVITRVDVDAVGGDIIEHYEEALNRLAKFREIASERYDLHANIASVLEDLPEVDVDQIRNSVEFRIEQQNTRLQLRLLRTKVELEDLCSKYRKKSRWLTKATIGLALVSVGLLLLHLF